MNSWRRIFSWEPHRIHQELVESIAKYKIGDRVKVIGSEYTLVPASPGEIVRVDLSFMKGNIGNYYYQDYSPENIEYDVAWGYNPVTGKAKFRSRFKEKDLYRV